MEHAAGATSDTTTTPLIAFEEDAWRAVLQHAENNLNAKQHNSFDAERYLLLLQSESPHVPDAVLLSPQRLFKLSKTRVMAILATCEVHPVGHRIAVYTSMLQAERRRNSSLSDEEGEVGHNVASSMFQAAVRILDDGHHHHHHHHHLHNQDHHRSTMDPSHHATTTTKTDASSSQGSSFYSAKSAQGRHGTTATATSLRPSTRTPPPAPRNHHFDDDAGSARSDAQPMTQAAFLLWLRTKSRSTLVSSLDDIHVQLLRPDTIGKRVHVGGTTQLFPPPHPPHQHGPSSSKDPRICFGCDASSSSSVAAALPTSPSDQKHQYDNGGVFDIDSPIVMPPPPPLVQPSPPQQSLDNNAAHTTTAAAATPPAAASAAVQPFTWIDVVGTWNTSRAPDKAFEPPLAFRSRLQQLREQYLSPSFHRGRGNSKLEKALISASRLGKSYRTATYGSPAVSTDVSMNRFASVQTSLAELLKQVEAEYRIELPLCTIARRIQDPDAFSRLHDLQRTQSILNSTTSLYTRSIQERVRQRIEDSMNLSYFNAAMFAEDELRELRKHREYIQREDDDDDGDDTTRTPEERAAIREAAEAKRVEEERRVLEELSHQHIFILRCATSPLKQRASAFLPPTGSEQHSDLLKTHHNQLALILSAFLETVAGNLGSDRSYSEQWILYVDTKQNLAVTVRPKDTVVIGRIHNSFDACFGQLPFTDFVGLLIEASFVHASQHVDTMYATLDDVQRFLAPSCVCKIVQGDETTNNEQREARRRRRKFNVTSHHPNASSFMNFVYSLQASVVRGVRSVWRKIRRRRTRPRDMTFAALRLLNLVSRQAAVFRRSLDDSKRLSAFAASTLCGISRGHHHNQVPTLKHGIPLPHHAHLHRPNSHHKHSGIGSPWGVRVLGGGFGSMSHLHQSGGSHMHGGHSHSGGGPHHHHHHAEDDLSAHCSWDQDVERLAVETSERCQQVHHLAGVLMSLAMALDAETYDENLAIIGFVTACFAPMSYWAANMGVNFRCPLFYSEHGYLITWICYVNFFWLLVWWFYQHYHNIDLAQVVTTQIGRVLRLVLRGGRRKQKS